MSLLKIFLTVVAFQALSCGLLAGEGLSDGRKLSNRLFPAVREHLWYYGINTPYFSGNVSEAIHLINTGKFELPVELKKVLSEPVVSPIIWDKGK